MTDVRQIYKRKISIDITSVGLASARPNYYTQASANYNIASFTLAIKL